MGIVTSVNAVRPNPFFNSVLVYPPNETGSVTITRGDMQRLEPDEFLNDTLVEYGMK